MYCDKHLFMLVVFQKLRVILRTDECDISVGEG